MKNILEWMGPYGQEATLASRGFSVAAAGAAAILAGEQEWDLAKASQSQLFENEVQELQLHDTASKLIDDQISSSIAHSGFDPHSISAVDLRIQSAYYQGVDRARLRFRHETIRDQVMRRGRSARNVGWLSGVQSFNSLADVATLVADRVGNQAAAKVATSLDIEPNLGGLRQDMLPKPQMGFEVLGVGDPLGSLTEDRPVGPWKPS